MSTATIDRPVYLTAPMIARRLGVSADKVLRWVRSGELAAVNLCAVRGGRPQWRVHEADLAAFLAARAAQPPAPVSRARRPKPADVIEFF